VVRDRGRWRVWQRYLDPSRFVFLDETGAATNMIRRTGWGPKGQRVIVRTPHGHWRTTTFVAGLRLSGIVAPFVFDGPMTGEVFRVYVEQILGPELRPGDVVVMDNLAAHKSPGIAASIRAAGASLMHLPPYSPDLNPIEQAFAKLKTLLRKAAARTRDELWDTIGTLLDTFSPQECQNYITAAGYEPE
jgi:transposase